MTRVVLALDTATAAVTAGLVRVGPDGAELLAERITVDPRAHAERLTPNVVAALDDCGLTMADVDAVAVGCGPGPFTGLRVGMATAAALGHALDVPVHPVCTLDAIAADGASGGDELVVTDARRREVFTACYRVGTDGGLDELMAPVAVPVDDLASHLPDGDEPVLCVGTGTRVAALPSRAIVPGLRSPLHRVGASHLVQRVDHGGERPVTPLYARLPDAEVNRRAALAGGGVG